MKNKVNTAIFFAIAMFLISPAYANPGELIYTQTGTFDNFQNMTLDSENNMYIVDYDGATKLYTLKVYSAVIAPTLPYRTINDWIDELTNSQSKVWGLANFFIILLFEYILFFSSIIYGFIYGFRFFNGKKDS